MNKVYKVIWSKVRNCYVVVSELAKRNGKCKAAKTVITNEGSLLSEMSGATSLHKAAAALLLAGMIAMPGVSEAKAVSVGYYDPTTDTKPASAGTVTGTDAIGIGTGTTGTAFKVIAQNAIGIGKNVTVGATNNAGDVVVAGNNAIGIGTNVIAKGNNSIANGYGAKANGMDSIALGTNAQALLDDNNGYTDSASKAIAIGYSAQALGDRSIAIGNEAYTNDKKAWAIAIGNLSKSTALGATSVGATAETYGKNSIALGRTAIAGNKDDAAHPDTNYSSISIGYLSKGTAIDAIAMGQSSQVTANSINSIAIGKFSQVGDESSSPVRPAENAIAIGYEARALGPNAVGIGTDTRARTAGAVAIGKDSGLAEILHTESGIKGASDFEAGGNSIAIGYGAKNYAANYDAKNQTYANTRNSIAIGSETHTHASYAVSIGANTDAAGDRSLAIGTSDTASNTAHTGARASGQGSIAIGDQAKTRSESFTEVEDAQYSSDRARDENANDAMAIGTQAEARATNAIAIGGNASYTYYQDGTAVKTIYATHTGQMKDDAGATVLDTRVQGAVVGADADAAIAIGGATIAEDDNGKKLIDKNTGKITLEYNPAHVYGKRSIAIGTGALVETSTAHDALIKLDNDNLETKRNYEIAVRAFTDALMDYNEKRNAFLRMTPPVTRDPGHPDYDSEYITKYDNAQADLTEAAERLFGSDDGAAKALEIASAPYETYMANRKQLLDTDATSVADSIAVGTGAEARSAKSIVLGRKARVNELSNESVAIGEDVLIGKSSSSSIAIGNDASIGTKAPQSIAIGYQATIGTNNNIVDSIAIGTKAGVFTTTGIAIGSLSQVAGMYSGAIGSEVPGLKDANVKEHNSVAGNYSYAIGNGNKIGKQDFDTNYKRKENDTVTISALKNDTDTARVYVFGARNSVGADNPDEDDANNEQKTDYVNVIGFKNTVYNTENASVFGEYNTVTNSDHSLIIGKYHNVDNATNSLLIGGHISAKAPTKDLTDVLIYGFEATLKDGIKESVGIGKSVTLKADNAIAIGTGATVEGNNSISIGTGNVVTGENSGAFGDPSEINGDNSYSVGNNNEIATEKTDVFALGNNITKVESNSVFLGSNSAYVQADYDTTGGTTAGRSHYNSMIINNRTYDFAGGDRTAGVVSVGGGTVEGKVITRRIQNVAPGLISAESTDAINGSQLYQAMQALSIEVKADEAKSTKVDVTYNPAPDTTGGGTTGGTTTGGDTPGGTAGGTTTADTPSTITLTPAITYEVKASTTELVLGDDADGKTSTQGNLLLKDLKIDEADNDPKSYKYQLDLKKDINLGENGSVKIGNSKMNNDGLTVGDTTVTNDGLTVGDTTVARDRVTVGDTTMNNDGLTVGDTTVARDRVKVGDTNVNSDGITIANGPSMTKDGINAGSKKITNVAKGDISANSTDAINGSQLYDTMNTLNNHISNVDSRARKGIAGAAALAALHPLEFDPDDKLSFAAGVGNFRGETAAAIGAFYRADEKTMFSIGGSMGNGENVVNAGVSFSLDRTPRKTSSRAAMAREIVELREQVAQLTAIVNQLAGGQLPVAPVMYPNTPENAWAYEYLENLQKQGTIVGYTGRELSRAEFAAALDRAAASGVTLDERIVNEFASELSRVNIAYVNGKGNDEGKIFARPRVTSAKAK